MDLVCAQAEEVQTWALMSGLAGYTLLLAVTAFLLVRYANVWDDMRTVLLLVVLMFLATSVTFDEVLVFHPERGFACYLGGLLFALLVSEGLLRGIRLALPACFRVPYYLILSLFFLYPLALRPLLADPRSEELLWGLFGFSPVAGLVFLTLLPAIRRGADCVRDNGSPWRWPLYPWVLFGLLGLAVPARSFLLCWSMQILDGGDLNRLLFGPFFLVPFGLSVARAFARNRYRLSQPRRAGDRFDAANPPDRPHGCRSSRRPDLSRILALFTFRIGAGPLTVTLLVSAAFYAYAALRRVSLAPEALTLALAALAVVGPHTLDEGELASPRPAFLLAAAALQLYLGIREHGIRRCVVGVGLAAVGSWRGYCWLRQFVAGLDHLAVSLALFALAILISLGKAGILSRWIKRWWPSMPQGAQLEAAMRRDQGRVETFRRRFRMPSRGD